MKKEKVYRLIDAEVLTVISNVLKNFDINLTIKPSPYEGFYYVKFEREYQFNWIARGVSDPNRLSGIPINIKLDGIPDDGFRSKKGFLLKPGKFLKALIGNHPQTSKIADKLSKALILLDKSKFSFSKYPSEIYSLHHAPHGTIGSSCMRDCHREFFYLYDDLSKGILYVYDDEKAELVGRALVWDALLLDQNGKVIKNHITFLDRVYTSSERLETEFYLYAKENNWYYRDFTSFNFREPDGKQLTKIIAIPANLLKEKVYDYYPYVDSFSLAEDLNGDWWLVNKVPNRWKLLTEFNDTEGENPFFHNILICSVCEERISEEAAYSYDGDYYCEGCFHERFSYCYQCEDYFPAEETNIVIIDHYGNTAEFCPDCVKELTNNDVIVYCQECNMPLLERAVYYHGDKPICPDCINFYAEEHNLFICPSCNKLVPYAETKSLLFKPYYKENLSRKRYCKECYGKWAITVLTSDGIIVLNNDYPTMKWLFENWALAGQWYKIINGKVPYRVEYDLLHTCLNYFQLNRYYQEEIGKTFRDYLERLIHNAFKKPNDLPLPSFPLQVIPEEELEEILEEALREERV